MSQLATSAQYLQNSIAAALMPALEALTPVIVQVADAISWAANQLAIFIAQVTGQKTVTIATKSYVDYAKSLNKAGDSAASTGKKVKELQNTIAGFDELNILQKDADASGGGGGNGAKTPDYSSMFKTIPTPPSNFSNLFKDVPKAFDKLKDATDKEGKALDKVKDKSKELEKELEKVKLPVLGDWKVPEAPQIPDFPPVPAPAIEDWKVPALPKIPDFPPVKAPAWDFGAYDKSKQKYQQPIPAPAIYRGEAPALDLGNYEKSRKHYQFPITAPEIVTALAPAILLSDFLKSRTQYQTKINPPVIDHATAPAIDLQSQFEPSINTAQGKITAFATSTQAAISAWGANVSTNISNTWENAKSSTSQKLAEVKTNIASWGNSTSQNVVTWGTNIMTNIQTTANYIPQAIDDGLNVASKGITEWVNSTAKNVTDWGNTLITNMGQTMKGWYKNFVSGLSSAWDSFTGFMEATGKKISNWWDANESWAAPAAGALAVGAIATSVVLSAGATAPAAAALVPAALALENGAALYKPTYALMAEYSGAQSNPEVVAPQSIIRQTVDESNESIVAALAKLIEIAQQISEKDNNTYLDGKKISENTNKHNANKGYNLGLQST
jgi:hypothetical protein